MFGIGGGELVFIMFIVLMLFGSDKIPEIARTMGKAMAQLKHATNDIKSEIQKGVDDTGFDQKTLSDLTGSISSQINKAKDNLLGETETTFSGISQTVTAALNTDSEKIVAAANTPVEQIKTELEDITGPIKRQM
ncbi:Sec-independent protein translocase subunit TatA/TatB [Flavobacterium restrictum]|uniref:Sec-independent protein translocase TatA n=1 Tax=Flavobacterium restrictum TaxID=2594428 RepID=A0A553E9E8_9FLAO|nr:twin-arginine translocase TatA/TatE family subunit [Flavobacterium restrictum]TRX41552.1 Sec-independent protein translocase TatA [Flavobacterium restrictum]